MGGGLGNMNTSAISSQVVKLSGGGSLSFKNTLETPGLSREATMVKVEMERVFSSSEPTAQGSLDQRRSLPTAVWVWPPKTQWASQTADTRADTGY